MDGAYGKYYGDSELDEDVQFYPNITLGKTAEMTPVAGHVSATYKGCLLVWGGYYYTPSVMDYRKAEDLYIYPYALAGKLDVWIRVTCMFPDVPKPNCGGSVLLVEDDMYVFGGTTMLTESLRRRNLSSSVMWKLSLRSGVWEFIRIDSNFKVPTPRDKMASWTVGKKLYFFGGYGPRLSRLQEPQSYLAWDEHDFVDGLHGCCWNNQLIEFDTETRSWVLIPRKGNIPSARAAPGACYVPELHCAFVFAGRHDESRLNDLYCFDMWTLTWTKIELDEKPIGRSWCTFTYVPDQKVVVMQGGYSSNEEPLDDLWHLDISGVDVRRGKRQLNVVWKCIRESHSTNGSDGPSIHKRFWHTASLIPSTTGAEFSEAIITYGGMNDSPNAPAPCVNTLSVEQLQPSSMFSSALRRCHPSTVAVEHVTMKRLKDKLYMLDDLRRFQMVDLTKNPAYPRGCVSLRGLSLGEVFEILDPSNLWLS